MTYNEPTLGENIIDSRDVIAHIEFLESEIADLEEAAEETRTEDGETDADIIDRIAELRTDLEPWTELASEGETLSDWMYGETLIRDSCFQEYAEELANDICNLEQSQDWPFRHIDWEAAADELRQDYTVLEFAGYTYYARA